MNGDQIRRFVPFDVPASVGRVVCGPGLDHPIGVPPVGGTLVAGESRWCWHGGAGVEERGRFEGGRWLAGEWIVMAAVGIDAGVVVRDPVTGLFGCRVELGRDRCGGADAGPAGRVHHGASGSGGVPPAGPVAGRTEAAVAVVGHGAHSV